MQNNVNNPTEATLLSLNGGSSSIKFALYEKQSLHLYFKGKIERIGTNGATLTFNYNGDDENTIAISGKETTPTIRFLLHWLKKQKLSSSLVAIGHRIVHGMKHTEPELISSELVEELTTNIAFDPEHLPGELQLIKLFGEAYPGVAQIACFDTSFHSNMPAVAKLLPLPRRFSERGIERYGFHGLSYSYLLAQLQKEDGASIENKKVILAHLGNGASLAAIKNGHCVDTSMGFTPASGLVMGTRTGDLDPGVAAYIMESESLTPAAFNRMITHESGLLGISETSADMRDLLLRQATDARAAQAVELFCYEARKWIGSFAAVLGGLDTLVFSGGIGEHAAEVRSRICAGRSVKRNTDGFGVELKNKLSSTELNPWSVSSHMMGETIPKESSTVSLDAVKKDAWGMPLLKINIGYDDNDAKMKKDYFEQMTEMFTKAGFINMKTTDTGQPPGLDIHEMGGVRMGRDPKTSLLNEWNQLHLCKNVFVTDGACMTSTSTQNPSLTYMALTARAVDYAVTQLKKSSL